MKRSLIVLLVVALLAMMVPTIASAATLTKFELNTNYLTGYVSRTINGDKGQYVLQTHGTVNVISQVKDGDSSLLKVFWTTSDRNVVGFKQNTEVEFAEHEEAWQVLEADGNTPIVELNGRGVGKAVLTGKCYWATDVRKQNLLGTVSLTVEAKLVPEEEVKINMDDVDVAYQVAGKKNTFEYWIGGDQPGDPSFTDQILKGSFRLEPRTEVHPDGVTKRYEDDWASTYGVSELIWSSSNEDIITVDRHGTIDFKRYSFKATDPDPITVVVTATAKGDPNVKGTVTFIIHPPKAKDPTDEAFKTVTFTQDGLEVNRGFSWEYGLNLADYLKLYPRPAGWYHVPRGEHTDDHDEGDYGVRDEINWTSSNENIVWIDQNPDNYKDFGYGIAANPSQSAGWADCFVVVSPDAEDGDQVTIRATSVNNPAVYDEIVLTVSAVPKVSLKFERNAYTFKNADRNQKRTLRVVPSETYDNLWAKSRYMTATSSDPEVVWIDEINEDGVRVIPRAPGQVTITLESERYLTAPITTVVTVAGGAIKSVTLPAEFENITMPLYDVSPKEEVDDLMNTAHVHVNINPANAWYRATWTSSDPSVAYVVYDGHVDDADNFATIRAAGVGTCTIDVTVTDGVHTFTQSINVTVIKAKKVQLALNKTKGTFYLSKGGDNTLQLIATDKKTGEEVPVTWKSSDKKIAKVSSSGLVTFKKEGQVKITATTKDGYVAEKSCTVTVKKLAVKKISVTKRKTMKVGDVGFISYRISPAKAYNPALTFKSSNKKVVTVDRYGTIEALKPGTAEITVTAKDGSGVTAKVTITVKDITTNADDEVIIDGEGIDLTLDGIDSIEDLGIDDGVVLNNGDVIEITLD